jgi:hypothetical protein
MGTQFRGAAQTAASHFAGSGNVGAHNRAITAALTERGRAMGQATTAGMTTLLQDLARRREAWIDFQRAKEMVELQKPSKWAAFADVLKTVPQAAATYYGMKAQGE